MSLVTLAVAYGYFMEFKKLQRLTLVILSVPIAVAANAIRIMGTGLLAQYWGPERSEGFLHGFSGVVIFVFSLALLVLLGRALRGCWHYIGGRTVL
jgi:exosortase/archaeosortase family protein